ncbi:MAG: Sec-independent protein translocase subunit TatA [Candidatus Nanopelagicaceae bacterium]
MFLREPSHILLLVLVLVILFGAKRLPDSAKSVAKSLRIFKTEMKSDKEDSKGENKAIEKDSDTKDDSDK